MQRVGNPYRGTLPRERSGSRRCAARGGRGRGAPDGPLGRGERDAHHFRGRSARSRAGSLRLDRSRVGRDRALRRGDALDSVPASSCKRRERGSGGKPHQDCRARCRDRPAHSLKR